jgi:hypothetical protein
MVLSIAIVNISAKIAHTIAKNANRPNYPLKIDGCFYRYPLKIDGCFYSYPIKYQV